MSSPLRFSKLPITSSERALDLLAAAFLGVLLLLSYQALSNNFLVESPTAYGRWPLFVLPGIGALVMVGIFWVQSSDWPISLPFPIHPKHAETAQRRIRSLLRSLNLWMQLILALLQYLIGQSASPGILLFIVGTALLVDLVLLMFTLMRLSKLSTP